MSSYNLLSPKIKSKIDDLGWDSLTDIQEKSIPAILNNDKDVLIISGTASGKTEAVLFPLITKINNFHDGIKILYISPLKALINDQGGRLKKLLDEFHIETTMWHGDASQSRKNNLLKEPEGILQITPESLEGFFIYRQQSLLKMFAKLEYVVIDEIHSFVGEERGYQLSSLIHRLKGLSNFKIIGLSATISDKKTVQKWINRNIDEVIVVESEQNNKKMLSHINYSDDPKVINDKCINDLYELLKNFNKAIIFANSRRGVEAIVSLLNDKFNERVMYPHHSFISKEMREYAEYKIKNEDRAYIVATSTLELGIDIGDLDIVIQIGHTSKVSSLSQRVGRSGRKKGKPRILQAYCSERDSLISLEIQRHLFEKGKMEDIEVSTRNFDYLFHQVLSLCTQYSGISANDIVDILKENPISEGIKEDELFEFIKLMLKNDYLEYLKDTNEFVLSIKSEKIVKNREFLTFFESNPVFDVYDSVRLIGNLDYDPLTFQVGKVIVLSGFRWRIKLMDTEKKKIHVERSKIGDIPMFNGDKAEINDQIRSEIKKSLIEGFKCYQMDDDALNIMMKWQEIYKVHKDYENKIISYRRGKDIVIEFFLTIKQVYTLKMIAKYNKVIVEVDDLGNIHIENIKEYEKLKKNVLDYEKYLSEMLDMYRGNIYISKYANNLDQKFRDLLIIDRKTDFKGLMSIIKKSSIVEVNILK